MIRPDEEGLRLFDVRTGSPLHDLNRPGRRVLSVMANPASERLLTIDVRIQPPGRPAPIDVRHPPRDEIEVILWDLNRIEEPVATLDRIKIEPLRRSFLLWPRSVPTGRPWPLPPTRAQRPPWLLQRSPSLSTRRGTARAQATIDTQAEMLTSLALGASNVMATASGNTIQVWDREAGTFLYSLSSTRGTPRLMRFNSQGTLLATAVGNHAEIWDTVSHKLLAVLPAVDWITDLSFTPDGRSLAVGGGGRTSSTSVWRVSDSAARIQLGGFESRPHLDGLQRGWLPGDRRQQRGCLVLPGRRQPLHESGLDHDGGGRIESAVVRTGNANGTAALPWRTMRPAGSSPMTRGD